jgi:hypothetical protein
MLQTVSASGLKEPCKGYELQIERKTEYEENTPPAE